MIVGWAGLSASPARVALSSSRDASRLLQEQEHSAARGESLARVCIRGVGNKARRRAHHPATIVMCGGLPSVVKVVCDGLDGRGMYVEGGAGRYEYTESGQADCGVGSGCRRLVLRRCCLWCERAASGPPLRDGQPRLQGRVRCYKNRSGGARRRKRRVLFCGRIRRNAVGGWCCPQAELSSGTQRFRMVYCSAWSSYVCARGSVHRSISDAQLGVRGRKSRSERGTC